MMLRESFYGVILTLTRGDEILPCSRDQWIRHRIREDIRPNLMSGLVEDVNIGTHYSPEP